MASHSSILSHDCSPFSWPWPFLSCEKSLGYTTSASLGSASLNSKMAEWGIPRYLMLVLRNSYHSYPILSLISPKWVIVRWVMKKIMILINKETTQMNNLLMLTMIIEILVSFSTVSFCFYLIHYYSYWLNCSEGFWRGWGKMEIGYGWVAIVC